MTHFFSSLESVSSDLWLMNFQRFLDSARVSAAAPKKSQPSERVPSYCHHDIESGFPRIASIDSEDSCRPSLSYTNDEDYCYSSSLSATSSFDKNASFFHTAPWINDHMRATRVRSIMHVETVGQSSSEEEIEQHKKGKKLWPEVKAASSLPHLHERERAQHCARDSMIRVQPDLIHWTVLCCV